MYLLKGFMVIQAFSDNSPGNIAPLGELSALSKTFSREVGHYSLPAYAGVDFYSFLSKEDDVLTTVPNDVNDVILAIGQWMFERSAAGNFNTSPSAFVSALNSEFGSSIDDLQVGEMISGGSSRYLPEWIEFSIRSQDSNLIKIWFADASFSSQYDEYHITIDPPLDDIDDLFRVPLEVKALLDNIDATDRQQRLQAARNNKPDTITRIDLYEWFSLLQDGISFNIPWGIIIYGAAGNNIDSIRQAIIDYITEHTNRDLDDWENMLPDIFKSTEYVITPLWTQYSIENQTLQTGLLSPIIRHQDVVDIAIKTMPEYEEDHIKSYLETTASPYRSVALLSVGSKDNRDGIMTLYERFKDYLILPTTSIEFSRMSPTTQQFVMLLAQMLHVADHMTEFSTIPTNLTRLIRNDLLYVVGHLDGVQYLLLSRQSLESLLDEGTP